ncbi:tetratricopeptide repeat protein [Neolewinella persica]|uniref:tetratricopeptide repeat protein n=1 Tax=Neolewinella persica TaxID=70998 RepID=UPI0012FC51C8|nr:tetratricopeptide repeat protein [Neolewinella persica]
MRLFLFVFLNTLTSLAICQTLNGVVLDCSGGAAPLSEVEIIPINQSGNQQRTNSNGIFKIDLLNTAPGTPIKLIVNKEGYALLGANSRIYTTPMPKAGDIIEIPLALNSAIENLNSKYVAAIKSKLKEVTQERDQIIKQITEDNLTEQERSKLAQIIVNQEEKIQLLEENQTNLAKLLSRSDLTKASAYATDALEEFKNSGDLSKALELLSLKKADEYWKNVEAQEEKLRLAKEKGIQNYMITARFQVASFNFEEAELAYASAVEKDASNYSNLMEFANFLLDQNEASTALKFFDAASIVADTPEEEGYAVHQCGKIYTILKQWEEAELKYIAGAELISSKDIEGKEDLKKLLVSTITLDRAYSKYLSGAIIASFTLVEDYDFFAEPIDLKDDHPREVLQYLKSAFHLLEMNNKIFAYAKEIVPYDQDNSFSNSVDSVEFNCRGVYEKYGNSEGILDSIRDYFPKKLIQEDSIELQLLYRSYLNDEGSFQLLADNQNKAKNSFLKALRIDTVLAKTNPPRFLANLAHTYMNLGRVESVLDNFTKSNEYFEASLAILVELENKFNKVNHEDYSRTFYEAGINMRNEGKHEEALALFRLSGGHHLNVEKDNFDTSVDEVVKLIVAMAESYVVLENNEALGYVFRAAMEILLKNFEKEVESINIFLLPQLFKLADISKDAIYRLRNQENHDAFLPIAMTNALFVVFFHESIPGRYTDAEASEAINTLCFSAILNDNQPIISKFLAQSNVYLKDNPGNAINECFILLTQDKNNKARKIFERVKNRSIKVGDEKISAKDLFMRRLAMLIELREGGEKWQEALGW